MEAESCEACANPSTAIITYLRETSRGIERIRRPLCSQHGNEVWAAMSAPLRDTAIIEHPTSHKEDA